MTLVGKILIVLNLVLSILFMAFALAVYSTQTNWRDVVKNPTATADKRLGLEIQLRNEKDRLNEKEAQLQSAKDALALEKAARSQALAVLDTRARRLDEQLKERQKSYEDLLAQKQLNETMVHQAENNMKRLKDEVDGLREEIREAQLDRDQQFGRVVELTDELQQRQGVLRRLEDLNRRLSEQVGRMSRVLSRNALTEFTPVHDVPPKLDGFVTEVGDGDLIEVSLGSDEGLRVGHKLEVYRKGGIYVGRIVVTDIKPDHSVARILPKYRRANVRKGDRVATRFS